MAVAVLMLRFIAVRGPRAEQRNRGELQYDAKDHEGDARDRDLLIKSALVPTPTSDEESESSLRRRRASVRLLRDIELSHDECHRIAALIESQDADLAIDAAAVAIEHGDEADEQRARERLSTIAPAVPWHRHSDVQSLLRVRGRGADGHGP